MDWICAGERPAASGCITPVVRAAVMSAGNRAAIASRVGARSTAGSWQDLHLRSNNAEPSAAEGGVWARDTGAAARQAMPVASAAIIFELLTVMTFLPWSRFVALSPMARTCPKLLRSKSGLWRRSDASRLQRNVRPEIRRAVPLGAHRPRRALQAGLRVRALSVFP